MPSDKLRRILEHVNKAVQLAQNIVRDVTGGSGFAVQEDWNVCVLETDFADKLP